MLSRTIVICLSRTHLLSTPVNSMSKYELYIIIKLINKLIKTKLFMIFVDYMFEDFSESYDALRQ